MSRKKKSNKGSSISKTKHMAKKRKKRDALIKNKLNGYGTVVDSFIVDDGHKDGATVHVLTNKAVMLVFNIYTGKLVTELILRDNQLKKYYSTRSQDAPENLIKIAVEHERLGYNNC